MGFAVGLQAMHSVGSPEPDEPEIQIKGVEFLHRCGRGIATVHTGISTFIVMRGYPGTGKRTIARLLATAFHAPLTHRPIILQLAVHLLAVFPHTLPFTL